MNILITGATGSIGREILRQLDENNRLNGVSVLVRDSRKTAKILRPYLGKIRVFYGDVTSKESLKNACIGQDLVIHLAAIIPPQFEENEALGIRVNKEGTRNVIETLEAHSPKTFLLFSSSVTVYGDRLKNPDIRTTDPLAEIENDAYGKAKIETEKLIQASSLNWSIFRLTAIMGVGNHKVSAIMFHVPLATSMEIATIRDTARAFTKTQDHLEELNHRIFDLSGGEECRITYEAFLTSAFKHFGMGKPNFPKHAFATRNFHCGNLMDGDQLEDILHFRSDTLSTYFLRFRKSIPGIQRIATRPFAWIVKKYLLSISEPYKAVKSENPEEIQRFFGNDLNK